VNSTEIIAWTRKEATLASQSTEYTSAIILQMLNRTMSEVIEPIIAGTRSGYWYHTFTRTLAVNNASVRLPHRSVPAIEQVDITHNGRDWAALSVVLEAEHQEWMREYGRAAYPTGYTIRGSYIHLLPAAKYEGTQLRVKILMRPSVLVDPQTTGKILAVDADTRLLIVESLPVSKPSDVAISGNVVCDVIEPRANFELAVAEAPMTVLSPTQVQVAENFTLERVEPGDYLRVANQSEWPQLPESFHSLVGSITAVPICRQRDFLERAAELQNAAQSALIRLGEHLRPRIRVQQHFPIQHGWT